MHHSNSFDHTIVKEVMKSFTWKRWFFFSFSIKLSYFRYPEVILLAIKAMNHNCVANEVRFTGIIWWCTFIWPHESISWKWPWSTPPSRPRPRTNLWRIVWTKSDTGYQLCCMHGWTENFFTKTTYLYRKTEGSN